jgi:hypothetical protein
MAKLQHPVEQAASMAFIGAVILVGIMQFSRSRKMDATSAF